MPPALPFEIWAHIASYLSSIELGRLFSINKALYEIYMDSRYKTLQLRRPNNDTVSKLRMMRDTASVADRVQDLEICYLIHYPLWKAESTRSWWLGNRLRHLLRFFSKEPNSLTPKSLASVQRLLLRAVNNMHGLRSVFFHLHPADGSVERYLDISRQVWLLICSRVNSLSIRAWAKHAYLLRPTFSSVYGIKHLFISLRGIYPAGEAHGLADLINTASQSLQSLRLEMSFISPSDPVRRIFTSLHGLCRLRRVDLSFYDAVGDEAVTFLNAHGESIDELKLSVCGTAGGAIFNIAAVRLPYLRKLSVAWNPFNWVDGSNIQFQHIWADADFSTLDHLEITSPFMDANDISIFCNVFERLGSNRMQHLQLPSLTVNTEILDLIWQTFPDLRTLVFIIPTISSESLISETAHREYPWEIDGVEITPPGQELGMPFYLHPSSYQSMRIAAKGTPSARSF